MQISCHLTALTFFAAYYYIVWGIWLRHCLSGRDKEYSLYWPSFWSVPEVRHIDGGATKKPKSS